MTRQIRLNRYERGIAEALEDQFGYTKQAARGVVREYVGVVRKLGAYDNCMDQADRLHRATQAAHPADKWLERINQLEHEAQLAGPLPHVEKPHARTL